MKSNRSTLDLRHGRVDQKLRTRRALLRAAWELMAAGQPVTVGAAAERAEISLATAYRYFQDAATLVAEAALDHDIAPSANLLEELEAKLATMPDIVERVLTVNRLLFAFTRRNEAAYRLFLAKSLELYVKAGSKRKPAIRGGRRIPMFEAALAPIRSRLGGKAFADLVHALCAASGVETYLALKDICQLPAAEIDRIAEKNLTSILGAALAAAE